MIHRLIREARKSCKFRGHRMEPFERSHNNTRAISACYNCEATVQIDTKPAPNGIDIGGDAVAINCR